MTDFLSSKQSVLASFLKVCAMMFPNEKGIDNRIVCFG